MIEAIEAGRTIDKIFVQKGLSGALFATLAKLMESHSAFPIPMYLWRSLTDSLVESSRGGGVALSCGVCSLGGVGTLYHRKR